MITEDYCSFEVAKLLKEKGFEGICDYAYSNKGNYFEIDRSNFDEVYCLRPTHQMAMKWLREEKNLHIVVCISYDTSVDADGNEVDRWTFWFFEVLSSISGSLIYMEEINEYDSYEEAVEAALKYCLENLI